MPRVEAGPAAADRRLATLEQEALAKDLAAAVPAEAQQSTLWVTLALVELAQTAWWKSSSIDMIAIYNPATNSIRTWVTEAKGALPDGYTFRAAQDVPPNATMEVAPAASGPVPDEIARWALREVCVLRGLIPAIETALQGLPEPTRTIALNRWAEKPTISRGSSMITALQALLGWTNDYVDDLFRAADQLGS